MATARADGDARAGGRVPGRRGSATRSRLLECTASLLAGTGYRDLTVADIARCAATSPATFYQYFTDVEGAVLELATELGDGLGPVVDRITTADWTGEGGLEVARRVVQGFFDYYEEHRSVYRVVDLAAGEGDLRFRQARTRVLAAVTEALVGAIGRSRPGAGVDGEATAYVLVSMLVNSAAHRYGMEFWGVRTSRQVDALARIVHAAVTGAGSGAAPGTGPLS